jgi:hypothetical protein
MPTMPKFWDAQTLKAHTQAANGRAQSAQAEQDWKRATIYVERALSNESGLFEFCRLPACRRARACRGNPTLCLAPESAEMQNAIDDIYVRIQQQRRAGAFDGRRLDMLDPVTRKLPRRK